MAYVVHLLVVLIVFLANVVAKDHKDDKFLECPRAPAKPQDRRLDKSKLRISTFNCEWLFLDGISSLQCPGPDCKWKDRTMAMNHLRQIARDIKALDSDILQLTEIEDCKVVNQLVQELATLGDATYRGYLVRGKDRQTGQNIALLTRIDPSIDLKRSEATVTLPVANSTCPPAKTSGSKGLSKHFVASFDRIDGFSKPLTLVSGHFVSRPTDASRCHEREAQATILSQLAHDALAKDHHVVITGDLNDWSAEYLDHNGNKPISNVLGILTTGFQLSTQKIPQTDRYSQWYDKNNDCRYDLKETSALDHILVSPGLFSQLTGVAYGHQVFQPSCNGLDSDHYPLTITLKPE